MIIIIIIIIIMEGRICSLKLPEVGESESCWSSCMYDGQGESL